MITIKRSQLLAMSLLTLMSAKEAFALAPQANKAAKPITATATPTQVAAVPFAMPLLAEKGRAYKADPNEANWSSFSTVFKSFLSDARTLRLTAKQIYQSNPILTDLRASVLDAHGVKLWTFPGNKDNHFIFAQKAFALSPAGGPVAVDTLEYPVDININDARIVHSTTTTVVVGPRNKKHTTVVEGPKFLCITGYKRTDGQIWLKAYKLAGSVLAQTTEPFAHVPLSLLQGGSSRAFFSGNNLVIGMGQSEPASSSANGDTVKTPVTSIPSSSSYQVVLKFEGNAFSLADKPQNDGPLSVAQFFVKTILEGRADIAKTWVSDPALVNITKYAGLLGKTPAKPYKLVAMTVIPGASVMARYRLVTYESQDLIIDIGRVKKETKVKGVFVAPSDPVARNLNGVPVGGPVPQLEITPTATPES
ncbi:MAG: hypothetical protein IPG59_02310 [Candidatus Melainabacteria bacterium]|nr:MAG: hypothetical protein IPG59_02310 [Candidatus Melainabacteria bacterium]